MVISRKWWGRLPKVPSACRSIKNNGKKKPCQNQLYQKFGKWSKVYSNQVSTESKRRQIKWVGSFVEFLRAFASTSLPPNGVSLERATHSPSVRS